MNFNKIISNEKIVKAINEMGFEKPSEIQAKAIPLILDNNDVIAHAKTGTGKTATFIIPILEKMDFSKKNIQCLILAPTRELAKQVENEITKIGRYFNELKTCVVYGGQAYSEQRRKINNKPQFLVATPGRLIDLLEKRYLKLNDIDYLVLDEADEMLSIGFAKELKVIASYLSNERQTMLFSATYNDGIKKLTKQYLTNPISVSVVSEDKITANIEQKYMIVNRSEKIDILIRLLMLNEKAKVMVFANTKKDVDSIASRIQQEGIIAEVIHGDLSQKMRENSLNKFRKGIAKVLVCSDVAARGLDIKGVDIVVNIGLPNEIDYYVHRVGRTGRANKNGISYTLITSSNERKVQRLAKDLKTTILKVPAISNKDIEEIKQEMILEKLEERIKIGNKVNIDNLNSKGKKSKKPSFDKESYIMKNLDKINPLLKKGYDLDSIFHALISTVFEKDKTKNNKVTKQETRLFINIGKKDHVTKKDLVNLFNLSKEELYDIDIKSTFSFCTLNVKDINKIIKRLNNEKYNKRKINVEIAERQ